MSMYQIVNYENLHQITQNLLNTDIAQNAKKRNFWTITIIGLIFSGVVVVAVNVTVSKIQMHVIELFKLKHLLIYIGITIAAIIIIRLFLWSKIEAPLVSVAARRELMHLYLGSKEYYKQKARCLYKRRLRGFTTPEHSTAVQRFFYYIGWYPVADIYYFTDAYTTEHLHKQSNKKTLVLDLDETLIASVMKERARNDENFDEEISLQSDEKFLKVVKKWYNIVIYTASKRSYAEPIVKRMNMKFDNCIKRLYSKESLVTLSDGRVTKDLSKVLEDLTKVVFIDNNVNNFILQPNNSILIRSWCNDNNSDMELDNLIPLLEALSLVDDVIPALNLDQ